jgi:hypothetical protein
MVKYNHIPECECLHGGGYVRYTRFEYIGYGDRKGRHLVLRLLIVIPAAAIISGYLISRLILIPYVFKPKEIDKEGIPSAKSYVYKSTGVRKFFIIQAGIFSSESNAQVLAEKIRALNMPVYINPEGQYFRVIVYAGMSSGRAEDLSKAYEQKGYKCIRKEFNPLPVDIPEEMRNDRQTAILSNIISQTADIADLCSIITEHDQEDADPGRINSLKNSLEKMRENVYGLKESETDEIKRYDEIENICSSMYNLFGGENGDLKGSVSTSAWQERAINFICLYGKLVESYNTLYKEL